MIEHPLLPCPFCGGEAKYAHDFAEYWAFCTVCGASSDSFSFRGDAEAAWNHRKPLKGVEE